MTKKEYQSLLKFYLTTTALPSEVACNCIKDLMQYYKKVGGR